MLSDFLRSPHHGQSFAGLGWLSISIARSTASRIVRLPGNRFRAELTEEIKPARDAASKIDIAATTQIITNVVEGWIREHPEQWLWLHRRWRPEDSAKLACVIAIPVGPALAEVVLRRPSRVADTAKLMSFR